MIRISQLKLPYTHSAEDLRRKAARILRISSEQIEDFKIIKQSVDARKKPDIFYIYTVDVKTIGEEKILRKAKGPDIIAAPREKYCFPAAGSEILDARPIIVGLGPAGLFCGLMLARHGYAPIILERGEDMDARIRRVEEFWKTGALNPESNVQFGEGGAGTFSDGKLNTLVKDPVKRNYQVLKMLVEAGADPSILYLNKPHIGTDALSRVVRTMRKQIVEAGGEVRFNSCVTDILTENGRIKGVEINHKETLESGVVVLAVGHSSRDTFSKLLERQVKMRQKPFAVGLRIQHPQKMINLSQYGMEKSGDLGAASYKLTYQAKTGRGIYSFCMCPGGYVVNASSEFGGLAVNGMSNHDRAGENANSALIVTVTPEDFLDQSPLAGVNYQKMLEESAFRLGKGKIPVQLYGDFKEQRESHAFGDVNPAFKGEFKFADLNQILSGYLADTLVEGINHFERMIRGFSRHDAILAGIESRTSSPVRIERDDQFESNIKGLYPCGEGAGYAGGITSAAMDGLKVAEAIAKQYKMID